MLVWLFCSDRRVGHAYQKWRPRQKNPWHNPECIKFDVESLPVFSAILSNLFFFINICSYLPWNGVIWSWSQYFFIPVINVCTAPAQEDLSDIPLVWASRSSKKLYCVICGQVCLLISTKVKKRPGSYALTFTGIDQAPPPQGKKIPKPHRKLLVRVHVSDWRAPLFTVGFGPLLSMGLKTRHI